MKKIIVEKCYGDFLHKLQNTQNHGPHKIGDNVFHLEILDPKKNLYTVYKNGLQTEYVIVAEYSNLLKYSNFVFVKYECDIHGEICDYFPANYEYWYSC